MKSKLNELIVKHTGQAIERVEKDTDRDYFMGATEARAYGIIDEMMTLNRKAANREERKKTEL